MRWLWFSVGIVLLLSLPFLRLFYKRLRMRFKLSSCCKMTGAKLIPARYFWLFGRRKGKTFDFYIDAPEAVYAVKLFTALFKSSVLVFTDQGSYALRYNVLAFGKFGVISTPVPSKARKLPAYRTNGRLPEGAKKKQVKRVLLVHPACLEMIRQTGVRKTELIYTGTVINGMEVHSLAGLIKEIRN